MAPRVGLVTGGSRGIGRASALKLAAAGMTVYIGYKQHAEAAAEVARLAGETGGRATPAGRVGRPKDIAGIVGFLAGPDGRWITGQTLVADGGLTLISGPVSL